MAEITNATDYQDALRSVRSFIGGLSNVVNDQSWDHMDMNAQNAPYGYQSIGPNGTAIEGTNYGNSRNYSSGQAQQQDNGLMLLFLGAAFYYLVK